MNKISFFYNANLQVNLSICQLLSPVEKTHRKGDSFIDYLHFASNKESELPKEMWENKKIIHSGTERFWLISIIQITPRSDCFSTKIRNPLEWKWKQKNFVGAPKINFHLWVFFFFFFYSWKSRENLEHDIGVKNRKQMKFWLWEFPFVCWSTKTR